MQHKHHAPLTLIVSWDDDNGVHCVKYHDEMVVNKYGHTIDDISLPSKCHHPTTPHDTIDNGQWVHNVGKHNATCEMDQYHKLGVGTHKHQLHMLDTKWYASKKCMPFAKKYICPHCGHEMYDGGMYVHNTHSNTIVNMHCPWCKMAYVSNMPTPPIIDMGVAPKPKIKSWCNPHVDGSFKTHK